MAAQVLKSLVTHARSAASFDAHVWHTAFSHRGGAGGGLGGAGGGGPGEGGDSGEKLHTLDDQIKCWS